MVKCIFDNILRIENCQKKKLNELVKKITGTDFEKKSLDFDFLKINLKVFKIKSWFIKKFWNSLTIWQKDNQMIKRGGYKLSKVYWTEKLALVKIWKGVRNWSIFPESYNGWI